jgi:hypothetical protein
MHIKHIIKCKKFGGMEVPKNQMEFEKMFATGEQCLASLQGFRFPNGDTCWKCCHTNY